MATGLLYALAYPPLPLGWLGWLALIPLGVALEERALHPQIPSRPFRSGFHLGYLSGFILFLAGLHWIAFLTPVAVTVPFIMFPAWPAAAAYLALYPAVVCAVVMSLRVRRNIPVALTLPPLWIAGEALRSLGELAFPWLSLGHTQWSYSPILQWASLGGAPLVGLWVAIGNGLGIAGILAWRNGRRQSAVRWLAAGISTVVLVTAIGMFFLTPADGRSYAGSKLALIQGNISRDLKWDRNRSNEVLEIFLDMSLESLADGPSLIIWPETATGSYLRRDPVASWRVATVVDTTGVPILSGFPDWVMRGEEEFDSYNAAGIFRPDQGLAAQYNKMQLVPFGERLPFQSLFPWLGQLDLGQAEWTPGESQVLLVAPPDTAAVLICFESIFPELSRRARLRGANVLVVITNDQWFGRTGALYQHAALSVFRAVENRMPLARCANTGLTFFVDVRGRIYEQGGVFTRETRIGNLDRPGPTTLFTRWGDWVGKGSLLVLTFAIGLLLWPAQRRF